MLNDLPFYFLTAFGIGFIIFIHELGHFMAARAVGVRVEAFSIGFGPKLFSFRRGDTEYRCGLVPLGGYVKMAGEDPTRPTTGKPDEFGSKTVAQRVLVISAGVIMNMIFALVAIPLAFTIGVPFESPEIGGTQRLGPAWKAGLRAGDRVVAIDDTPILTFEDIPLDLAVAGGPVDVEVRRGALTFHTVITPEIDSVRGVPAIGIAPVAASVRVPASAFVAADADPKSAARIAALASAGLSTESEVLRLNGLPYNRTWWETEAQRIRTSDAPVELILRAADGQERAVRLAPLWENPSETGAWRLGVEPRADRVSALRPKSLAAECGLRVGDIILRVDGTTLGHADELPALLGGGIDPRRLGAEQGAHESTLAVRRADAEATVVLRTASAAARSDFLDDLVLDAPTPLVVDVSRDGPAAAVGMQCGDRVLSIGGSTINTWDELKAAVRASGGQSIVVSVERAGTQRLDITVAAQAARVNAVLPSFAETPKSETVRLPIGAAISAGIAHTGRVAMRVMQTLRSVFSGTVSSKHLGGIITIFRASVSYSQIAFTRGLLFLALVSINLAILNILPIPVLDGGWLMFLIIEKLRGAPLPERAMAWFQWGGLAAVLGLMLYVTWNDVARLVGWM
ncbi:MAG: RIP metalloprotease RseP [Planctomycetes bacterium]|nr:RIP metalloprotease RseP [Planctomycetota bacterium]